MHLHSQATLTGKGVEALPELALAHHPPAKHTGCSNDPSPQQSQRRRLRHRRRRRRRRRIIAALNRDVPRVAVGPLDIRSKEIPSRIPNKVDKSNAPGRSDSKHQRTRRVARLTTLAGRADNRIKKISEGGSRVRATGNKSRRQNIDRDRTIDVELQSISRPCTGKVLTGRQCFRNSDQSRSRLDKLNRAKRCRTAASKGTAVQIQCVDRVGMRKSSGGQNAD